MVVRKYMVQKYIIPRSVTTANKTNYHEWGNLKYVFYTDGVGVSEARIWLKSRTLIC